MLLFWVAFLQDRCTSDLSGHFETKLSLAVKSPEKL